MRRKRKLVLSSCRQQCDNLLLGWESTPWQPDPLGVNCLLQDPTSSSGWLPESHLCSLSPPPAPSCPGEPPILWLLLWRSEAHAGFTSWICWVTAAERDSLCPFSDLLAGPPCSSLQCFSPWPHRTSLRVLGGPTVSLLSCRYLKFSPRFPGFPPWCQREMASLLSH